jgi:cytosine/adenosine deaminase-related metal-dependent hydrolase
LGSKGLDTQRGEHVAHIDLSGFVILPGLINAHDHLEFALFPRLRGGQYSNATQWAHDIQENQAKTIARHKAVPVHTRLWWGGIRNLLCGVTTVCHHNPMDPLLQNEAFPVRVLSHFGWEHSLTFASDIPSALKQTPHDAPFIIHACEGIDAQAASELRALDRLGALEPRTVLVHALALDSEGVDLIAERGAAVILCPSSNNFLFEKVPDQKLVEQLPRLTLGSDSPLTAAGDLLDELRFASEACGIDEQRLYDAVTGQSSSILRLRDGEGSLRFAGRADLLAVRDRNGNPAEILSKLTWRDVELVLLGGRVQLASEEVFHRLPGSEREGLQPLKVAGVVRWLRAPINRILDEAELELGENSVYLGDLPIRHVADKFSPGAPNAC